MTTETAMLSPDRLPDLAPLAAANDGYAIVRRAIAYISEQWRAQPEIEQIAHAVAVQREHARGRPRGQLLRHEHAAAPTATRLEVAGVVEQAKRLAHGRARQLELLRETALGRQALAGCEQSELDRAP